MMAEPPPYNAVVGDNPPPTGPVQPTAPPSYPTQPQQPAPMPPYPAQHPQPNPYPPPNQFQGYPGSTYPTTAVSAPVTAQTTVVSVPPPGSFGYGSAYRRPNQAGKAIIAFVMIGVFCCMFITFAVVVGSVVGSTSSRRRF